MSRPVCRSCGTSLEHTFVDLGMSPLSNAFLKASQLDQMEAFFPLHVRVCHQCFLVQLPEYEKPEHIFNDYAYFSSYSDSWLSHAKRYTEQMIERFSLGAGNQVLELASNDGYLLRNFVARGIPVLGIEPARNVAEKAIAEGVPTEVRFFGTQTAKDLVQRGVQADLLAANNVLAHVPDINDFVAGISLVLRPKGVATLEFPHLSRLIAENQFDTIYHEHFSYLSLHATEQVFARQKLEVFDVEELPTHGGSLRVYLQHQHGPHAHSSRVAELRARERAEGVETLAFYTSFRSTVERTKRRLLSFLIEAKEQGKQVVGYGAAAKGNTLLNYCGVREDLLSYVVDRSPHKQGRFLPGTHIPVFSPEELAKTKPAYVLILPWNLRDEVVHTMGHIRSWGGKFVVPIPTLQVLE